MEKKLIIPIILSKYFIPFLVPGINIKNRESSLKNKLLAHKFFFYGNVVWQKFISHFPGLITGSKNQVWYRILKKYIYQVLLRINKGSNRKPMSFGEFDGLSKLRQILTFKAMFKY